MELSDGWYSVAAAHDAAMESLLTQGKVKEGTKMMVSGASLIGLDQGCDPLDVSV